MIVCLRCATTAREEDVLEGCSQCEEAVFLRVKHTSTATTILTKATIAEKEALLDAIEDALGEDADRQGVIILDVDSIEKDEGTYRATLSIRDPEGTRTVLLDEEPALEFLAQ